MNRRTFNAAIAIINVMLVSGSLRLYLANPHNPANVALTAIVIGCAAVSLHVWRRN
jgi:hypothetical protein